MIRSGVGATGMRCSLNTSLYDHAACRPARVAPSPRTIRCFSPPHLSKTQKWFLNEKYWRLPLPPFKVPTIQGTDRPFKVPTGGLLIREAGAAVKAPVRGGRLVSTMNRSQRQALPLLEPGMIFLSIAVHDSVKV